MESQQKEKMTVNLKTFEPSKLLWLDLEMTGLDPKEDLVLELAIEVTDMNLETLDSYENRIKHPKPAVVDRMNKNIWWRDYPENRNDFLEGLSEAKPIQAVEKELLRIIEHHFGKDDPVVLAGNSIYNDRLFIKQWFPELELRLHYRMLDVTSFKILMQSRYSVYFEKPEVHRAYEDVQASIAELQHYFKYMK